jgi:hypothetical protein
MSRRFSKARIVSVCYLSSFMVIAIDNGRNIGLNDILNGSIAATMKSQERGPDCLVLSVESTRQTRRRVETQQPRAQTVSLGQVGGAERSSNRRTAPRHWSGAAPAGRPSQPHSKSRRVPPSGVPFSSAEFPIDNAAVATIALLKRCWALLECLIVATVRGDLIWDGSPST